MLELSAMASLDTEDMRVLTRSALGPGVGESSSEAEQEARSFSRTSYVIEDPEDDVDDEITAVFNDETEEAMTRSWHGSRSSSQRSLAFFVDLSSSAAAGDAQQLQQRRVASARARTRAASCSTAFFVELGGSVRSTSRQETSDQLQEMSSDISIKSKEIFAKNIQQSQSFFTKLKAFIDFLNMPNYSKEEVRHKKVLADKITRVMFEEEQRLRRGMDLSELKNLDSILNVKNLRPNSAYASMQNTSKDVMKRKHKLQCPEKTQSEDTASCSDDSKPVLRRERTFDLEHGSILSKELRLMKQHNRKSMPIIDSQKEEAIANMSGVKNGWMIEDAEKSFKEESKDTWTPSEEFNLLKYFQQQRLEHTRLLRKEITRLENLEKVYLEAIKKSNSASSKAKVNQSQKKESCDRSIKKQKNPQLQRNKTEIFDRNETFTKSDRKRITEKLAGNNKYGYSGHGKDRQNQKSTTNFREVADRKMKSEGCCSILPPSQRDSPSSWYIPSDPPSRSQSISLHTRAAYRQNSVEDEVTAAKPSRHSFGWSPQVSRGTRTQARTSHQHQQATQTGNSLLRMYMKKANKGLQVCERPQAFFLPLDQQSSESVDYIDLELSNDNNVADLQGALKKNRPDYIAAAEERAGRLSRNNEEKKESKMTKSTEIKTKKTNTQGAHLKRSQSTPRVNSILKSNETRMKDENRISNNKGIKNEKSVTILQNGDRTKSRVAVLKSRPSMVNQQHYNLKNIYGSEVAKGVNNKVC